MENISFIKKIEIIYKHFFYKKSENNLEKFQ